MPLSKNTAISMCRQYQADKTDSAGKEIPYLERVIGGVIHKADIFSRPVSFSTTTLATDNPEEALAASLNKYGTWIWTLCPKSAACLPIP
jgi:hypothetical protein